MGTGHLLCASSLLHGSESESERIHHCPRDSVQGELPWMLGQVSVQVLQGTNGGGGRRESEGCLVDGNWV